MPLARYFVSLTVLEDFGNNDVRVFYAVANDGTIWVASSPKPGDPSTVWSQLPDLPQ